MKNYFFILLVVLIFSSCSPKAKQRLGLATAGPNEYAVERSKALEVPPHYDLPLPGSME